MSSKSANPNDTKMNLGDIETANTPHVERRLEVRHLQMIAIGASIGTGLFLTSGQTMATAGAVGSVIAYLVAGISVFFVVHALGEMATLIPTSGSFNTYSARFVDPALGFTSGWIYWFGCTISIPIELMACASFLGHWIDVDQYIIMAVVLVSLIIVNSFNVKGFGEIEYWLSLIKIAAIVFFIIVTIWVIIRDHLGFSNYSKAGGPFLGATGFQSARNTYNAMNAAIFAFSGTELVGVTAGEAKNPRKSVPKAINGTFWRIMIFYIVSMFLIGILLPADLPAFYSDDDLAKSPFVIALEQANIFGASDFMNFICFVAVFSAANSTTYASTRSLMALAHVQHAPSFVGKTASNGIPYYSLAVSILVGCICFIGKFIGDGKVFTWLINICGLGVIVIWCLICLVHIRFRKAYLAQGYKIADLPFKAFLFPYGSYFAIFVTAGILILSPINAAFAEDGRDGFLEFLASFITIPVYLILFLFWKFYKKTKLVPLEQVDLRTGNINLNPHIEEENMSDKPSVFERILACIS